jgi:hypothetical protein
MKFIIYRKMDELEIMMLSKIFQTQKDKYQCALYMQNLVPPSTQTTHKMGTVSGREPLGGNHEGKRRACVGVKMI